MLYAIAMGQIIILPPILHCFQLSQSIGQSLSFDKRYTSLPSSLLNALVLGESLQSYDYKIWRMKARDIVLYTRLKLRVILNCLGMKHDCDRQTDRQKGLQH